MCPAPPTLQPEQIGGHCMPAAESGSVLAAERAHLAKSRAALRQMREHTAGLTAIGGDHVSTEHLKQVLYRRMKSLEDSPDVPLFFGRLDYDTASGAERNETLYIGRRHVTGEAGGEPLVIDWRAAMSRPFYQARPSEPMGVLLRRRFGFAPALAQCATSSPPSSPSRTVSFGQTSTNHSAFRVHQARAKLRLVSIVPLICSTPSAINSPARASSSSVPTTASCPTSPMCCQRWVRSTPGRPRSARWCVPRTGCRFAVSTPCLPR